MQSLRSARLLARFVLAWFALVVGIAVAAPLVEPDALQVICSGSGMKLVAVGGDEGESPTVATLDCPLCAAVAPPPAVVTLPQPQPLAHVLQSVPAARLAALTAPVPPARGPPSRFA